MEYALNIITRNINVGEYGVLNKINEGKINTDILISGSSRALKAVNPEIIKIKTGIKIENRSSNDSTIYKYCKSASFR